MGMERRFEEEGERVVMEDVNVKRVEEGIEDIRSKGI